MTDKIRRYARILWKYKWIAFYAVVVVVFEAGSLRNDTSLMKNLFGSGIWALLIVGGIWLITLYIRFTISYCRDVINLHKHLEDTMFESRYQREVERQRRKAEKRMRLKNKIKKL